MDIERKLKLMKQSYLSGYNDVFGGGLDWAIQIFMRKGITSEKGEEYITILYQDLQILQDHYENVIPFNEIIHEMEAQDWDDFAVLFKAREFIPRLKAFIDEYVEYLRANNYHTPENIEILGKFNALLSSIYDTKFHKGVDFRNRILKYDPDFRAEQIK